MNEKQKLEIRFYLGLIVHSAAIYTTKKEKGDIDEKSMLGKLVANAEASVKRRQEQNLQAIVAVLNREPTSLVLHEVKAELTRMVRDSYSAAFEQTITGKQDSPYQAAQETIVEGGERLLKKDLEEMLERIRIKEGLYMLVPRK